MVQVRRLGYVVMGTPDISAQTSYYQDTLGLTVTHAETDLVVLTTAQGVEAVVLTQAERPQLERISFEIGPEDVLADAVSELNAAGAPAQIVKGYTPNVDELITFKDPAGWTIELFQRPRFATHPNANRGVNPLKLGHVARLTPKVVETQKFYQETLGFRLSDWRDERAFFLRCGPDHHSINIFYGKEAVLSHIAFEVKDYAELGRCSDLLAEQGMKLSWGPSRHNIGHNIACYHRNPDQVRVELYAEMDQMKDEALGYFEPRPWHQDRPQFPKHWEKSFGRSAWLEE